MPYYKKAIIQTRTITVLINADNVEQAEAIWADSPASISHYIDEEYPSEFWQPSTDEGNVSLASASEIEDGTHLSDIEEVL